MSSSCSKDCTDQSIPSKQQYSQSIRTDKNKLFYRYTSDVNLNHRSNSPNGHASLKSYWIGGF